MAQIEYNGTEGQVTIVTVVPSAAVLRQGYEFSGQQAGTFTNGLAYWASECMCDKVMTNVVQWGNGNAIVQMLSTDLSLDQLEALAPSVVMS